jgi:hypothetical protein
VGNAATKTDVEKLREGPCQNTQQLKPESFTAFQLRNDAARIFPKDWKYHSNPKGFFPEIPLCLSVDTFDPALLKA